jgi:hypothetical protein
MKTIQIGVIVAASLLLIGFGLIPAIQTADAALSSPTPITCTVKTSGTINVGGLPFCWKVCNRVGDPSCLVCVV